MKNYMKGFDSFVNEAFEQEDLELDEAKKHKEPEEEAAPQEEDAPEEKPEPKKEKEEDHEEPSILPKPAAEYIKHYLKKNVHKLDDEDREMMEKIQKFFEDTVKEYKKSHRDFE